MARAMAARLRMPPESSLGILAPASAGSPACARRSATSASMVLHPKPRVLAQRHGHVLRHRQRGKQRAVLEHHAEAPSHRVDFGRRGRPHVGAQQAHAAGGGPLQADHLAQQHRLAGAAAPISPTSVPRPNAKLTPSCTVWLPKRVTTPSTSITAAGLLRLRGWARRGVPSPPQRLQDHGKGRIEQDHRDDALHHGGGGGRAHRTVSRPPSCPCAQAIIAMNSANTGALTRPTTTWRSSSASRSRARRPPA
jgi:hypothetical protein